MNEHPPRPPMRPDRATVGPLRVAIVSAVVSALVGCGHPAPTTIVSPSGPATSIEATAAAPRGDIDGLVLLTGGALSMGTADDALVGLDGPGGPVSGFSAANGRIIVETTGPMIAVADIVDLGAPPVWRPVEMATTEIGHWLSPPALSPRGDRVAFAAADPGTTESFQVFVLDLGHHVRRGQSFDRESNGPPVWIDDSSLLVEVVPIPGGTRFLRVDTTSLRVDPVRSDGYGPAVSGDARVLAIASNDGTVVAVPTSDWLAGVPPDEGAMVDASGHPFGLAVDRAGRRVAIGYADDAGDPASVAVFVRDAEGWRRGATPIPVAAGTVTMLGWLN